MFHWRIVVYSHCGCLDLIGLVIVQFICGYGHVVDYLQFIVIADVTTQSENLEFKVFSDVTTWSETFSLQSFRTLANYQSSFVSLRTVNNYWYSFTLFRTSFTCPFEAVCTGSSGRSKVVGRDLRKYSGFFKRGLLSNVAICVLCVTPLPTSFNFLSFPVRLAFFYYEQKFECLYHPQSFESAASAASRIMDTERDK